MTAGEQTGVPPPAAGVSTGRPSVPRPGPDSLDWPRLLTRLGEQLDGRLSRHIPTTEDTVRYLFFLELFDAGVTRDEVVLERPHPDARLKRKEIDLSLLGMRSVDLEVKYHRPIPSGQNSPLTQLRGQLIGDWYKLALSNARERYSLYAAALQIAEHMQKHLFEALEATADRPFAPEDNWLERSERTEQDTIKGAVGFLPRGVPLRVHCVAAWQGRLVSVWLLMVT